MCTIGYKGLNTQRAAGGVGGGGGGNARDIAGSRKEGRVGPADLHPLVLCEVAH